MNVPYLSGCFMLMRTKAVQKARLFDERFFMYPEDIDLTRRIHRDYLTIYYPYTTIIHNHEKASYRSGKMLWIHIVNMCRYFNKWGWFYDPERKLINNIVLSSSKTIEKDFNYTPAATSR
jgi:GT2 family glycosyltransferase